MGTIKQCNNTVFYHCHVHYLLNISANNLQHYLYLFVFNCHIAALHLTGLWCSSCHWFYDGCCTCQLTAWVSVRQANNKFGKLLEANRALRKQIDDLRIERQHFDNLYKKLDKERQDLQHETNDVIDQSTQAHDQRQSSVFNFSSSSLSDINLMCQLPKQQYFTDGWLKTVLKKDRF